VESFGNQKRDGKQGSDAKGWSYPTLTNYLPLYLNLFNSKLPAKTDSAHGQFGYNDCVKRYG